MKKIMLALVGFVLVIGMAIPVLAASPLRFNTWVHTSQGIVPNYPTAWSFGFLPNFKNDGHGHAFVGTSTQGDPSVFKSTDSGVTWNGTAQTNATSSLAVSPNYATDHLMVAGTASSGVWQTRDEWATTTEINGNLSDFTSTVLVVAFSPNYAADHQLFAGTRNNGLFMTVNVGTSTSWTHMGPGGSLDDSRITAIVFTPDYATSHTLFVAANGEGSDSVNGIYRGVWNSVNSRFDWTRLVTGLSNLDILALVISPNYAIDGTLYAGTIGYGLFKSANHGNNWIFISGTENLYVTALAISPDYAVDHAVYIGASSAGVYRYFDSALSPSLTRMNAGFLNSIYPGVDITALTFAPALAGCPRILFAGVWEGAEMGGVWQFIFPCKVFIPSARR